MKLKKLNRILILVSILLLGTFIYVNIIFIDKLEKVEYKPIGTLESIKFSESKGENERNVKFALIDSMVSKELDNINLYRYRDYDKSSNAITHADEMINIIHSIDPSIQIDLYVVTDENDDIDNQLLHKALSEIKEKKYDVINMSFYTKQSNNITKYIDDIYNDGSLIVASAGNLGDWIASYPASLHNVLCIGGITKDSNIWSDSNRGDIDYVMPVSFYSNISNKNLEGTSISSVLFSVFSIKALKVNADFNREDLINYINSKSVNPNEKDILGKGQPCF